MKAASRSGEGVLNVDLMRVVGAASQDAIRVNLGVLHSVRVENGAQLIERLQIPGFISDVGQRVVQRAILSVPSNRIA